jgi:hypothetical protein
MRERGQSVVEWLAVLAGVSTLATGIATQAPGLASDVSGAMRTMVCRAGGGACAAPPATAQAAAATTTPAATEPPPAAAQGDFCGARYFNVPELWFSSACQGHDRCYAAHAGKAACDSAFLRDMLAACERVGSSSGAGVGSGITRASCRAVAHLYYKGVVIGGGPSYCHRLVCRDDE